MSDRAVSFRIEFDHASEDFGKYLLCKFSIQGERDRWTNASTNTKLHHEQVDHHHHDDSMLLLHLSLFEVRFGSIMSTKVKIIFYTS